MRGCCDSLTLSASFGCFGSLRAPIPRPFAAFFVCLTVSLAFTLQEALRTVAWHCQGISGGVVHSSTVIP